MAMIDPRDFLTCSQAAKALRLTPDTVRQYCNNAKRDRTPTLDALHIGRDWLIPKTEVARYKRDRQRPGRPESDA
jgi:hypothetical protein